MSPADVAFTLGYKEGRTGRFRVHAWRALLDQRNVPAVAGAVTAVLAGNIAGIDDYAKHDLGGAP